MTPGAGLPGWERLRHGGLLPDGARLEAVSRHGNAPAPLDACTERRLRPEPPGRGRPVDDGGRPPHRRHLAPDRYGQLLDGLHARGLLDDLGYRRRRGHYPPAPSREPLPRVAEPDVDYHADPSPKDGQTDLFDQADTGGESS